jgi:hypothetical protein
MPRRKTSRDVKKAAGPEKKVYPSFSEGVLYAFLIGLVISLISGLYYKTTQCAGTCTGENVANGYPYPWFGYNTYEGWQTGAVNWLGSILDVVFWAFIAYVMMLVLHAAIKEA